MENERETERKKVYEMDGDNIIIDWRELNGNKRRVFTKEESIIFETLLHKLKCYEEREKLNELAGTKAKSD